MWKDINSEMVTYQESPFVTRHKMMVWVYQVYDLKEHGNY